MDALHGTNVVTEENVQDAFPLGYGDDSEISLCYSIDTMSADELTARQRRLLRHLASEPGMEGAAGIDFTPGAGEFVQLVTEGAGNHVCGAMIFRLSIHEGRRRTMSERQWDGEAPGPTVEVRLVYRAGLVRRYPDPEQEQLLHVAIAAGQAQSLTYAVRRLNDLLEPCRLHVWVTIGAEIDKDIPRELDMNPSLLRVIQEAIDGQGIWLQEDGLPYFALDGIEACHDLGD